ncbi:MAG: hypothetical protein ACJ8H8_36280 [Geminicoccaceae bacterium]|jgi:hypothetical protein
MVARFALLAALFALAPGAARAQADGAFPGTLSCDALPAGNNAFRAQVTVTISGGRARYTFPAQAPGGASGGTETGTGTLGPDRRLVLTGQARGSGFAYTARYAGEVSGRGGLLAGTQTWTIGGKPYSRSCQLLLGAG